MQNLLPILIGAVALATALNVVLKRFNIPTVIGYIVTGAIIGPLFGVHAHGNEQLEHVAEFGIVFLMFTIGLEFSVSHLLSMKREVFLFGALQVLATGAMFALIAVLLFGLDYEAGIIVGAGLALSSTAIVLKILNETGQIKADFGRYSLGILLFQDLAVIPILLMITIFTSSDKSISELLLQTLINAVIVLGILVLVGKYLLGHFFKAVTRAKSKEIYMGFVLLTVVSASFLAHAFGFSYSLGGFIAGMLIAETIYKYQVEADLVPFRDLLLGVFFVSVGLQIDLGVVVENIFVVILLGIAIMLVKAAILFGILSFSAGREVALRTAITLAQVGEFSLVVFSLLLANQMLDSVLVQIVMVTVVISMISTPFVINNANRLVGLFFKGPGVAETVAQSSLVGGHLILCGYGSFGQVVSDRLDEAGIDHVVVTNNTDAYIKAKEAGKSAVFGDAGDRVLLENLQVKKAIGTVLALDDVETIKRVSASVSMIDPGLKIIAKVPTEEDKVQLQTFNHELLIDGNSHTASLLVDSISRSRLLAAETSKLKFLADYSLDDPAAAIVKVELEQARLFDIMSKSFDGLRGEADILQIKAFHDSFRVLSEIIDQATQNIMSNAKLSAADYERLNTLMHNQHLLVSMNETLEELAKELKSLEQVDQTSSLPQKAVEGLDTLLLTVKALALNYDDAEMGILKSMTSEEDQGISRIREAYLGEEAGLDAGTKALLLSCTNHIDRLRTLFGSVGDSYRKLAGLAEGSADA
jgi:CPA2 family monovalent cation:H+ antiporter-2